MDTVLWIWYAQKLIAAFRKKENLSVIGLKNQEI